MFGKYEQRCFIKFILQGARMLNNAIQHYWKLVLERLYYIVPWLGGRMHFAEEGKMFINAIHQL